eukprot:344362-Hanusia_phi.AAC.1
MVVKVAMLAAAMAAITSLALASPLASPDTILPSFISQPSIPVRSCSLSYHLPLAFSASPSTLSTWCKARISTPSLRPLRPFAVASKAPVMMVSGGGGAVLEKKPEILVAPQGTPEQTPGKPYHVLLFNDVSKMTEWSKQDHYLISTHVIRSDIPLMCQPVNTKEYVCQVLCEIFGHSKSKAYNIMQAAHSSGFAVCNTTDKEEADLQCAKLGEKNLMSRVVEAD